MSKPSPPEVRIEGLIYRSNTFDQVGDKGSSLPAIDARLSLADLLRKHQTDDVHDRGFWSLPLLQHILSRDRVLNELQSYENVNAEECVEHIRPKEDFPDGSGTQTYLKVFALLVLQEKGRDIVFFIDENISDRCLPLCRRPNTPKSAVDLGSKDSPQKPLSCLQKWNPHERVLFEKTQWEVLVPFFELDDNYMAKHYQLDDKTILPWCKRDERSLSSTQPPKSEGGFAEVSCVKIDPFSHGFREVLKAIFLKDGLFALKILSERDYNNEKTFRNEADQLRRFNGLVQDHLVTLLGTFTMSGRYHFIFPYADEALDQYWERREPEPLWNIATIRWVIKQCSGIMAALDTIHNPKHLHHLLAEGQERFGRHGDIKPDNILWFDSSKDPRGIFVLSDFGLAAFHRETSRSNIPNEGIPGSPGYRPPECDIKGGQISRAYDIWTLGCLFLELLTWLLGGKDYLENFQLKRTTTFLITGAQNNIFYCLNKSHVSGLYVAQVKPEVTEWIDELHDHRNCSQLIHEALDVIEEEMLVVISEEKKRSLSGPLRSKFEGFYSKCQDSTNLDYCTKGTPIHRLFKAQTAVDADLIENATNTMDNNPSPMKTDVYRGNINKSLREEGLKNIDRIQRPELSRAASLNP